MNSFSRGKLLAVAAVLVAAISGVALLGLTSGKSSQKPLVVEGYGKTYSWRFGYPGEGDAFASGELHVPLGRPVDLHLHALDLEHGFWVPEWRIKQDVPPGVAATAAVTPDRAGTFQVICSEICGVDHATMRATLVVEPAAEFRRWIAGLDETTPAHLRELSRLDTELGAVRQEG
jgi:cytochrome c oxidase subunit II